MSTTKIIVDGAEVEVPSDYTLLQACEQAGAEIPRFCYHERLSIAGNCRMCLVEWRGAPKPIASCAYGVRDLRPDRDGTPAKIFTKSPMVKKAREGVMEFLLINHPLDCPICDQGGECDLQDQAMAYGRGGSRYELNKRAVEDKYMGPLIKTIMTRCIQCTRCVRFAAEVAGVEELGATGRGEDMEITTYLEKSMTSELSGNVIDLCPVGALTSKPYAFNARPWELRKTETIDVMDALGSNIRVDARGPAVMRILPRVNEEVNEEWISDKTRFVWDGLGRQRLDRPYVRENGKLRPATWDEALGKAAEALSKPRDRMAGLAGDLQDAESLKAFKDLMAKLDVLNTDCRPPHSALGLGPDGATLPRESYLFNTTIYGIEDADAVLLIGTNPRKEAAVLNARIRKAWLQSGLPVARIGEPADLTYPVHHLGAGPASLAALLKGGEFLDVLKAAKRPMIVVGEGALTRADGHEVLAMASALAQAVGAFVAPDADGAGGWNGFNVLHTAAARVAGLDMGLLPRPGGKDAAAILKAAQAGEIETVFLLGVDWPGADFGEASVIYLGSHGDAGAHIADIILPGAAYTEKAGAYVNTEGRVQTAARAVFPKGEAREDWAILRALSGRLGKTLPYDSLSALQEKLRADHETFRGQDFAPGASTAGDISGPFLPVTGRYDEAAFTDSVADFYLSNPIARASKVMAECSVLQAGAHAQAAE